MCKNAPNNLNNIYIYLIVSKRNEKNTHTLGRLSEWTHALH